MPPADDYARRLAHELESKGSFSCADTYHCRTCDRVTALIARVRADALEEAARLADKTAARSRGARAVAVVIRALKEKPPAHVSPPVEDVTG